MGSILVAALAINVAALAVWRQTATTLGAIVDGTTVNQNVDGALETAVRWLIGLTVGTAILSVLALITAGILAIVTQIKTRATEES